MRNARLFAFLCAILLPAAVSAMPIGCGTPNTAGGNQINVSPTSLTFVLQRGASGSASLNISEIGGASADNWTASTSVPWLSVSPAASPAPCTGACGSTTVTANASDVAPGNYSGSVLITPTRTCSGTVIPGITRTVPATLNVADISLTANPSSVTLVRGGPLQTVSIAITRQNFTGSLSLVVPSPPSGVGASGSGSVTGDTGSVTLQAGPTAPLITNQAVTIRASGSGVVATTTILLTITPEPAPVPVLAVSTETLQFAANVGTNPAPQTFQVLNSGTGTLGWTAVVSGALVTLSPTTGTAPSTVNVNVNSSTLAAGTHTATITISALPGSNATNSPRTVQVTVTLGAAPPFVPPNAVVNGASFSTEAVVSPSSIASLFGQQLSSGSQAATILPLPTTLAGTQLLVNDVAAPLFFVGSGQINFQIPANTPTGTVSLVVISAGVRSNTATLRIGAEEPGIFTVNSSGSGQGAILNQDSTRNGPSSPEARGRALQIYLTGLGRTNPPLATGQIGASTPPFNETVGTPVVLMGGISAQVLFSAMAPGFVGLYQINAVIPPNAPTGDAVELEVQAGGRRSNRVTVAIR